VLNASHIRSLLHIPQFVIQNHLSSRRACDILF
jgi:hypothetical protein